MQSNESMFNSNETKNGCVRNGRANQFSPHIHECNMCCHSLQVKHTKQKWMHWFDCYLFVDPCVCVRSTFNVIYYIITQRNIHRQHITMHDLWTSVKVTNAFSLDLFFLFCFFQSHWWKNLTLSLYHIASDCESTFKTSIPFTKWKLNFTRLEMPFMNGWLCTRWRCASYRNEVF